MGRWWCAGPPPAWRSPPANSAESKATENSQFSLRNLLELPTISLSKVVRLPSQVAGSPPKFHGDRDILSGLASGDLSTTRRKVSSAAIGSSPLHESDVRSSGGQYCSVFPHVG